MLIAHPISSLKMSGTREGTEVIFVKQTKVTFMCPISELTWVSTQGQYLIFSCLEIANFRTVQTIKGWIVIFLLIWAEHVKEQISFSLNKPKWHLSAQFMSWLGFQLKDSPWFLFSCFETANFRTVQPIKGWIVIFFCTYLSGTRLGTDFISFSQQEKVKDYP